MFHRIKGTVQRNLHLSFHSVEIVLQIRANSRGDRLPRFRAVRALNRIRNRIASRRSEISPGSVSGHVLHTVIPADSGRQIRVHALDQGKIPDSGDMAGKPLRILRAFRSRGSPDGAGRGLGGRCPLRRFSVGRLLSASGGCSRRAQPDRSRQSENRRPVHIIPYVHPNPASVS